MSAEPQFTSSERVPKNRHLSIVSSDEEARGTSSHKKPQKAALVPQAVPRSRRTLMVLLFATIPLILLFVLLINIFTASKQYDLVDLKTQELALSQQNEALSEEIAYYQAPQDLAIRASQLGLVATQAQATINLQTGEISGTPMVATQPDEAHDTKNLIDPPALYDTDAYATASQRADDQRKKDEAEAKAKAEEKKKADEKAKADASASASASPSAANNSASAEPTPSAGN
ncbi:MAG: hypothetical protein Q3974_01905 [Rothia sp. (in: high G+C Gram-positive bacteria)]|nr:hypothetical protein [Rothia sp. (in: high G+C Gram-positive bacteria)]